MHPCLQCNGSNGWLDKRKKRYNVTQLRICGESGGVPGPTVDSWKGRLTEDGTLIKQGFLESITQQRVWDKREGVQGGKISKQQFAIAFFVTASGKKEEPVVN